MSGNDPFGTRLPELPLSLIRRVGAAAAPGAVSLALGEPSHPVPAAVREALARAVAESDFRYTANAGRPELRAAVAATRPGHGGGAESAIVTVGTEEALALAVLGLAGPGDEVVVPTLAFPSYDTLPRIARATVVRADPAVPGEVEAAVTDRTRLVVVGSPSNPTGEVLPPGRFAELARLAEERGLWLLSDEVYAELYLGDEPPSYPAGPRVLHVGGVSKSLALTGLRAGWLVAPPALVERLVGLHQNLVTCAPSLAQAAAAAGLALPPEELAAIRALYRARWRLLRDLLGEIPDVAWREPEGAFYAWVDVSRRVPGSTEELAFRLAREDGVVVVPGEAFGPAGRGHLRLSYAASEEAIREGVRRLAAGLSRSRR